MTTDGREGRFFKSSSKQGSGLPAGDRSFLFWAGMQTSVAVALICPLLGPAEHSGPVACGDCNTDVDGYSKEQAFYPPPVTRDNTQPGTLSSQDPSQTDREHSLPHLTSGTADGSRADRRGSLYPSNHDRMLTSLKKKPLAPPDGKGRRSRSSKEAPQVGGGR